MQKITQLTEHPLTDFDFEKHGFSKTANNFGWMSNKLEPISEQFIQFASESKLPVLDIGTAFGFVPSQLLQYNVQVIANDLYKPHLEELLKETPDSKKRNLTLDVNRFPEDTNFTSNSLGAILVSRIFHFLTPEELELGVKKMFDWLAPGGKAFVFTNAPYRKNMIKFSKEFDEKKSTVKYPGILKDINTISSDIGVYLGNPFFHYLDASILERLFSHAGFEIEIVKYYDVPLPEKFKLDGRESVGIIAVKP